VSKKKSRRYSGFHRLVYLVSVLSFWFLVSNGARAQDTNDNPSVVEDVIKQFQKNSTDAQNSNTTVPPANNNPNVPQTIPGIVAQGDNAELPAVPEPPPSYEDHQSVVLRALDKVTARTRTFEIPVGQQFNFGALTVAVRACRARPSLEPADAAAFLQIVEQKPGEPLVPRFSGWMFSSSPSLSALEHPVYDVWVVGCGSQKN